MNVDFKFNEVKYIYIIYREGIAGKYKSRKGRVWYARVNFGDDKIEYGVYFKDTDTENVYFETEIFNTKKEAQDECNKRNDEEKKNKKQYLIL